MSKIRIILVIILAFSVIASAQNVGNIAPDFNVKDWNGNSQSLSKYRGKVVLLKFWAAWCGPCRASFKAKTQKYYNKYGNKGLIIFAVGLGSKERDEKFLKSNGYKTHVNIDGRKYRNQIQSKYHFRGIPFEVLISKKGKILWKGHPYRLSDTLIKQALAGTAKVTVEKRDAKADLRYIILAFDKIIKKDMRSGFIKSELRTTLSRLSKKANTLKDFKSLLISFEGAVKEEGKHSRWNNLKKNWQNKIWNAGKVDELIAQFTYLLTKGLSYGKVANKEIWRKHASKIMKIIKHYR